MTKILIYNSDAEVCTVIVEPFAESFDIPPHGTMTIDPSETHEKFEINLAKGQLTVWVHGSKSVDITN